MGVVTGSLDIWLDPGDDSVFAVVQRNSKLSSLYTFVVFFL